MKRLILLILIASLASAQLPIGALQVAPERYLDVPEAHWAYAALMQATRLGILTGYPDGTFGGQRALSRYEAAVIAARLLDYTDSLIGALSGDPEFVENLREASQTLSALNSAEARIAALERAMAEAASLAYVQSLEARLVELERLVNALVADDPSAAPLPAAMTDPATLPLSAAEAAQLALEAESALEGAAPFESPMGDGDAMSAVPSFPFYLGVSPGLISTRAIYLMAQFGYDGLIGPLGVVGRLGLSSASGELRLGAGPSVRVPIAARWSATAALTVGASFTPEGPALLFELPVGVEYLITPQLGVFGQLATSYALAPVNAADAQVVFGLNLRF